MSIFSRSGVLAFAIAVVFAMGAFTPPCTWAAGPAAADEDAGDKAPLRVMSDFNRDGIADLAEISSSTDDHSGHFTVTVSLGQPDGTFKWATTKPLPGGAPRDIVAGDFNGDGVPDLIVGDDDGTLTFFAGDGKGNLTAAGDTPGLDSVVSIAVGDFNHDGILDLAVSDWRASSVTVLLGTGNGSFRREWSFPLRMPGKAPQITTADFNRDGVPDLVVIYPDDAGDTFDVMLGTGNGTFVAAPELGITRDPNAHCVT